MSLNKYMHSRNLYKTPPNFKQLAIDYPDFRPFVIQDVSGKVSINFKNLESLRALTCTLLKKDFGLNVEIPLTKMIPTVPLRLNYILWIEDLLSIAGDVGDICGVDVGTGASCIYALLGAKNGWKMLGTDVDDDSLKCAQQNVEGNSLAHLIQLKKVTSGSLLKEVVDGESFDFCMCNPPFFTSPQELNHLHKARRIDRPRPRNAFCATNNEVVVEGGELSFIQKMIEESKDLGKSIRIYTTMVGHKSILPQLKKLLREIDVISFKQTEFCQGHTTRWGLAWTFHDIDLRKVPAATLACAKKSKPKACLSHTIPSQEVSQVAKKLKEVFNKLSISNETVKEGKNSSSYCITAATNTWSHQRRKRRERERLNSVLEEKKDEDVQTTSDMICNMTVHSPKGPTKRELDEEGFYNTKKIKMGTTGDYEECYLKASVNIRKEASGVVIEFIFVEGVAGREGLHQVLQYIKNNIEK
ncbi:hypothetical protein FQR65_LT12198 [Abscondita terminalis]|nr:hypothetical protein FQR65_LT12198 [Abscondita terminalis]